MWRYLLSIGLLLGAQVTVPPIADAAELTDIEARGRLIVAVKDNWYRLGYRDVTGELSGQRITSFSLPYYLDGTGFITTSTQVSSLNDLQQIAVLKDSSTLAHVRYQLPEADITMVSSYGDAIAELNSGRVDAFAGDVSLLTGWQQQDSRYQLLDEVISVEPVAIAIPKGTQYSDLRRAINDALRRWDDEGWLQDRAAHWGLQ